LNHSKPHLYLHKHTQPYQHSPLIIRLHDRALTYRSAVNMVLKHLFGLASVALTAKAQSSSTPAACPSSIAPAHGAPSVAPGFRVQVVANNLQRPRSIQFDSAGGLLVVEQGYGISRLQLSGDGACVRQSGSTQVVVNDNEVNIILLQYDLKVAEYGQ
jgi:glucose/arabinose dehydrogenase